MATVQPKGEDLRKAVKWISEKRMYESATDDRKLIDEACAKFNLSPKDAEYLHRFVKENLDQK
jgi:hypothetical protein